MKKAIVSGALGLVGRPVVNYLVDNGIDVLCLGRKNLNENEINNYFCKRVKYVELDMENINNLPDKIKQLDWEVGNDCSFYNFAWSGVNRLTDGTLKNQLKNAIYSSLAVKSAKKIGCTKFINCGSVEENFHEWYLYNGSSYDSSQEDYAIAKLASRDMCSIIAYLEKIDYIHTRLSVPLSPDLSKGGYISKTLKNIINNESYQTPKNNQLYDIISTNDVARAYYLIGLHGKNKADYFIGSGNPSSLNNFFKNFKLAVSGNIVKDKEVNYSDISKFFNINNLYSDTGFFASSYRSDLFDSEKTK